MTARCFNDSCSVEWDEVITGSGPAYQADVKLDEERGLECVDPDGVRVKLALDTPVDSIACYNSLVRTSDGRLHTREYPAYVRFGTSGQGIQFSLVGDYRGVPNDDTDDPPNGDKSSSSLIGSIVNPYVCEAVLMVEGRFEFNFEIADNPLFVGPTDGGANDHIGSANTPAVAAPTPQLDLVGFNANLKEVFLLDGVERVVNYAPVGGIINTPSPDPQFKKDWRNWSYRHVMDASQSMTIADYAQYVGVDQNLNVQAAGSVGTERGFRSVVQFTILPIVAEL